MSESDSATEIPSPYRRVIKALAPELLVQFNAGCPRSLTTEELTVVREWDGDELLLQADAETYYKVKDGADGFAIYGEYGGHFIDHYADIVTIEVVGVAS